MNRYRIPALVVTAIAGLAWAAGCGDGATAPPTPPPDLPRPTTVAVTPASARITALGATVQLSAQVLDQNGRTMAGTTVTWASSATAVATVSAAGLVTAVANGTATITATAGGVSGTADVLVAQEASAVAVLPAASTLVVGDTVRLTVEATDANDHVVQGAEFSWVSDDTAVAVVDATGLVTGVGAGTATVTVTARDPGGSEVTQTASVTVEPANQAPVAVGTIPAQTMTVGETANVDLAPFFSDPAGDALKYTAASSNTAVATVTVSGATLTVTAVAAGTATVTVTATDPGELSASQTIPVTVTGGGGTSGDRAALVALYNATDGPNWVNNDNWLTDAPLEDWYGVDVDEDGLVRSLVIQNNNLSGAIPPELGNLTSLEWLAPGGNRLSGAIPPELGNLVRLERLWLWGNNLSGPIPPELGSLAHLTQLSLVDNDLSGPIPRDLVQLANLERFIFGDNDGLCAPGSSAFVAWLEGVETTDGPYCNEADAAVLEQLYNASGGPNWTNSGGWRDTPVLQEWYGVTANALGRVVELDLNSNGLDGRLPGGLGNLTDMTTLRVGSNALTGRLPSSLAQLPLRELHYADTELCAPPLSSFREWLNSIASHRGTDVECAPLSDREVLVALYDATGGPNWSRSDNWLTAAPLRDWYGVYTDVRAGAPDRVYVLDLARNNLTGTIPAELGNLSRLAELVLWNNSLSARIPPELGNLASLESLTLGANELTGPIPAEFGNLSSLTEMWLQQSNLSGPLPPELGNLAQLQILSLYDNALTGPIPPELGQLTALEQLELDDNRLTGPVPREIDGMSSLKRLTLTDNAGMSGPLPPELTGLELEALMAGGTDLCAPGDTGFQTWLATVYHRRITPCGGSDPPMAYLTQAVQSQEFPVPLVAGEKALLRVFPTARQITSVGIPAVRARFYVNDRETHVENIPGKSAAIPTEVDESSLSKSANAEIPAEVIQPGLEMVIEVDPEGTLDEQLGVASRIPETGRLAVDVRTMPLFDLTLIPMIWTETGDSSIVDLVAAAAADPENHEMLEETRTLLPVGTLDAKAHEPVLSSSNNIFVLRAEAEAIRVMEGSRGHHVGLMEWPVTGGLGVAFRPGRAVGSLPVGRLIAHELGHNMNLSHAPCRTGGDPSYPYPEGSIGAWGYDFRDGGRLVPPSTPDLMSYCDPRWISDYSFTNALRYRLFDESSAAGTAVTASTRSLLLWGGLGADSVPFLEPAFVVDAPAFLPDSAGSHRITGYTSGGAELFSLSFTMPETADGDGRSSFAFVLPVRPGWEGNLARITLDGPGGSVTLDRESDSPMAILLNPRSGQVRGILRDLPPPTQAARDAAGGATGPGLEVLFSRGIPGAGAWRR